MNERRKLDTRAARRAENIKAAARLNAALAAKKCIHCAQHSWEITHTEGDVRSVRCLGCGRSSKLVLKPLPQKRAAVNGDQKPVDSEESTEESDAGDNQGAGV